MNDMKTRFDHLVFAAATLEQGVQYIQDELDVSVPYGGEHPDMGTHNHLMRLGEKTFCEIIAINPDAAPLSRPRWFGLDDPMMRASLRKQPRLITWVAATTDIQAACDAASLPFGTPTWLSRGDLRWQFAVPPDGSLLNFGMLPNIIQWPDGLNPASRMSEMGCSLETLVIHHPHATWYADQLKAIGLDSVGTSNLVEIESLKSDQSAYLVAHLMTPNGSRLLSSKIE